MNPFLRDERVNQFMICPLCHESLQLEGKSLRCQERHTFDISKQGSVNLIPNMKASREYDKENFAYRGLILEHGFYDAILSAVAERMPEQGLVLDVACGEGYYARSLAEMKPDLVMYAFDLSKDSIQLAAKKDREKRVRWLVADLANLPFADQSVDVLLDIYSPANYQEFKRVLKPGGILIKVVPNVDHVKELRELVAEEKGQKGYSNHELLALFGQHFMVQEEVEIRQQSALTEEEREAFVAMSPVLFHTDHKELDLEKIQSITVAGTLLVGKLK